VETAPTKELSPTEQDIQTIDKLLKEILDEFANNHQIDLAFEKYESLVQICGVIRKKADKEVNTHMDQIFRKYRRTFADLTSFSKYVKQIVIDIEI